jgi:hypothetical protein
MCHWRNPGDLLRVLSSEARPGVRENDYHYRSAKPEF